MHLFDLHLFTRYTPPVFRRKFKCGTPRAADCGKMPAPARCTFVLASQNSTRCRRKPSRPTSTRGHPGSNSTSMCQLHSDWIPHLIDYSLIASFSCNYKRFKIENGKDYNISIMFSIELQTNNYCAAQKYSERTYVINITSYSTSCFCNCLPAIRVRATATSCSRGFNKVST